MDPVRKVAAATKPTMAVMKGVSDGAGPAGQGPAPDLAGRVDASDGRSSKLGGTAGASTWEGRKKHDGQRGAEESTTASGAPRRARRPGHHRSEQARVGTTQWRGRWRVSTGSATAGEASIPRRSRQRSWRRPGSALLTAAAGGLG
jgi:hypothetical protein